MERKNKRSTNHTNSTKHVELDLEARPYDAASLRHDKLKLIEHQLICCYN